MAQKNIVYIGIYIIIPEREFSLTQEFLYLIFPFMLVYTNALLATLNAREQLRIRSSAPLSLPNLSYTDQTTTALPTPIDQPSIMLHSTAPSFLTSEFRDVSFSTIDPVSCFFIFMSSQVPIPDCIIFAGEFGLATMAV